MEKYNVYTKDFVLSNKLSVSVDINNPVYRLPTNPILTAKDVNKIWTHPALQVKTVHNAGIASFNDEVIMLFRSHLRNGISILGIARSKNGIDNWKVDQSPAMIPAYKNNCFADRADAIELIDDESGGIEDPRIIYLKDSYLITYSAYNAFIKNRVRVAIATTEDFKTFKRYGPVLNCDMRNVVIFPEKIKGKYVGLFRPNDITNSDIGGIYTQIHIGYTTDWKTNCWKISADPIIKTGHGPSAISDKIGPGAPPIKTNKGWLNIFHGVRTTMDGNPYVLSVALHDLNIPDKVKVSNIPILFPASSDCRVDDSDYIHVPNVVFTCGAIRHENGLIYIYYGGNDTVMNLGITHEDILIELCEKYGQDPISGKPCYNLRDI